MSILRFISLLGAFSAASTSSSAPLTAAHLQQALAGAGQVPVSQPQPLRLEEILSSDSIINSDVLQDPEGKITMLAIDFHTTV